MGAVPKNKITRAERGKRRQGNRPKLAKDLNRASTPLHKRGLAAAIFKAIGLKTQVSQAKPKPSQAKK